MNTENHIPFSKKIGIVKGVFSNGNINTKARKKRSLIVTLKMGVIEMMPTPIWKKGNKIERQ